MTEESSKAVISDFVGIVTEIHNARHRALQGVNKELVLLYWNVGKQISEKLKSSQSSLYLTYYSLKHQPYCLRGLPIWFSKHF